MGMNDGPGGQLGFHFDPDRDRLDKAAREFHAAHPEVMSMAIQLCREVRAAGRDRWAIDDVFSVMRWQRYIKREDADLYKLNNNHRAWYARYINTVPGLDDLFEVRGGR